MLLAVAAISFVFLLPCLLLLAILSGIKGQWRASVIRIGIAAGLGFVLGVAGSFGYRLEEYGVLRLSDIERMISIFIFYMEALFSILLVPFII